MASVNIQTIEHRTENGWQETETVEYVVRVSDAAHVCERLLLLNGAKDLPPDLQSELQRLREIIQEWKLRA